MNAHPRVLGFRQTHVVYAWTHLMLAMVLLRAWFAVGAAAFSRGKLENDGHTTQAHKKPIDPPPLRTLGVVQRFPRRTKRVRLDAGYRLDR
jgi:hypothetical protein